MNIITFILWSILIIIIIIGAYVTFNFLVNMAYGQTKEVSPGVPVQTPPPTPTPNASHTSPNQ